MCVYLYMKYTVLFNRGGRFISSLLFKVRERLLLTNTDWTIRCECLYYYSGGVSHQLSATRLLSSPEGSRHPLDGGGWPPWGGTAGAGGAVGADSYSSLHRGTSATTADGAYGSGGRSSGVRLGHHSGFWGCFRACQARIHHSIAKRKVRLYTYV